MPHYEFFCHGCKKFFDKVLSLVDYEAGEIECPHCGSNNVEQQASLVGDWFSRDGMSSTSPRFPYIRNNIRAGRA